MKNTSKTVRMTFPSEITRANNVHVLSVSGGKDSTAMYLLAMEMGVEFLAVFADTGNEHEITLDYISKLPGRTGGPQIKWVRDSRKEEIRLIAKLFPERIDMIREWEMLLNIMMKTNMSNFFRVDRTPLGARTLDPKYGTIDHVVEWSKTKHCGDGRQMQFDLDDHACLSAFTACE